MNVRADLDFCYFQWRFLAFRGAEEEYGAAETEFLDRVLEAANVTRDRLFMVPGNHDVDRSRLNFLPDFLLKFDERSKVIEAFEDAEIRAHLLFPMKAYSTFVKRFMKDVRPFDPEYGFIHQLKPIHAHTKSVAILGLNSAWMCGHLGDLLPERRGQRLRPADPRRASISRVAVHNRAANGRTW